VSMVICKRDDNWFTATARAMVLSLVVVVAAVVVVSGTFISLDAQRLARHDYSSITQCLVTEDGERAIALWWNVPIDLQGWTHRLTLHHTDERQPATNVMWPDIAPSSIAPAASPGVMFVGDWNGSLYEVSSLSASARPRLVGRHTGGVVAMQASADGRHLISLSPTAMCAWDLASSQLRWQSTGGYIECIRLHPDSSQLYCGMSDGQVALVDLLSGERIGSMLANPPQWPVHDLDVTPDGKQLSIVHSTGELRLVCAERGDRGADPAPFCEVGWPRYARFSPCGSLLTATAASEKPELKVWSLASGQPISTLRGHTGIVLGLAYSVDGRLFSWGQDGSIRVWDPLQGQVLRVIPLPSPNQTASLWPSANWSRASAQAGSSERVRARAERS
jgi:WD40 repeat protein